MRKIALGRLKKLKVKKFLLALVYLILFFGSLLAYLAIGREKGINPEVFKNRDYQEFEKRANVVGAAKAYQALKKFFPDNNADGHDFAHVVGFVAFEKNSDGGISICDNKFNYGCFHGFMIKFFAKNGVGGVSSMENVCLKLGNVSSPSCLHGIGHGLMMQAGYRLDNALGNCQRLGETSRTYCWDGVFMERIAGSMQAPEDRLKITQENLDWPCTDVEKYLQPNCFRNQVSVWLSYYRGDSLKAGSRCVVAGADIRSICFESVGLANVLNKGESPETLVRACKFVDEAAYNTCVFGEIKELLFEGKSPEVAKSLCGYIAASKQQECQSLFAQAYADWQERFGRHD